MYKYNFLEKIAIADIAFEAVGESLEELFKACALATFEVMVDYSGVEKKEISEIKLSTEKLEDLLFDFLAELIFLKDARSLLFSDFELKIQKNEKYHLEGKARGERIDKTRHKLKTDVKAVTYHMLQIEQKDKLWKAKVILDT